MENEHSSLTSATPPDCLLRIMMEPVLVEVMPVSGESQPAVNDFESANENKMIVLGSLNSLPSFNHILLDDAPG